MAEEEKKYKTDLSFMFGEYNRPTPENEEDSYVGFFKNVVTGESVMKIVDNPKVNIYVTAEHYRTHKYKIEWAPKVQLDEYVTLYRDRAETLDTVLNGNGRPRWWKGRPPNLKKLMSSPYVYGADIDFGVRVKYRYELMNGGRKPESYNVGGLDIETDVNEIDGKGSKSVIICTFIDHKGNTFVGIRKKFFADHTVEEVEKMWKEKTEPEFLSKLTDDPKTGSRKLYEESGGIKIVAQIFDEELDLLKWIFDCIHVSRPDFVTIWNMDYDIPYILERLNFRQADPRDVLCSPDIPKKYRQCTYYHDNGKKQDHITDRWHVLHLTDYTKYVDAMCMYARIRKASTRKPSYNLDAIATEELGSGKLKFGLDDHHTMQLNHKVEYVVYNIVDVLLLRLLDLKNHDTANMLRLLDASLIDDYARQSVQLKNTFFCYLDMLGGVPASMGDPIVMPWDKYITNKGGQVLDPCKTVKTGVAILVESSLISFLHKLVCDIDVNLASTYGDVRVKTLLTAGSYRSNLDRYNASRKGDRDTSKNRLARYNQHRSTLTGVCSEVIPQGSRD